MTATATLGKFWHPVEAISIAVVVHALLVAFFLDAFDFGYNKKVLPVLPDLPPAISAQLVVLPKFALKQPVALGLQSADPLQQPKVPEALAQKAEVEAKEAVSNLAQGLLGLGNLEKLIAEEAALMQQRVDAKRAGIYVAAIIERIGLYWSRPLSAHEDMFVEMRIQLVPTGELVGVALVTSSGNSVFDRSALLALEKASPLPVPEDPAIFDRYFRHIKLKFSPKDL